MHVRIGRFLHIWSKDVDQIDRDNFMFQAADQYNKAYPFYPQQFDDCLVISCFNQDAGVWSLLKNGFKAVKTYLRRSSLLLKEVKDKLWQLHYQDCLDIHNTLAELEAYSRDFEECSKTCNTIAKYARCFLNKTRAFDAQFMCFQKQNDDGDGIKYGQTILTELHLHLSLTPSKSTMCRSLTKTRYQAGRNTDRQLIFWPKMSDKNTMAAVKILATLLNFCFLNGDVNTFNVINMKMLRFTLKYSLCAEAALLYDMWGVTLILSGSRKEAI